MSNSLATILFEAADLTSFNTVKVPSTDIDDDGKIKKAFSNEIIEDTGFAEGYGIITSISKNKLTFEKFGKRIFNKQINKSARVRFKDTSHYFIYTKEVESQIKELGNSIDVKENVDYGYSEGKLTII